MNTTTILLVDDHKLLRDCWTQILNSEPDLEVCGAVATISEAQLLLEAKKPHIVLLDISLGTERGEDLLIYTRKRHPLIQTIMVSMYMLPVLVKKMMALGARGYLSKNSSADEMVTAIRQVENGYRYICADVRDAGAKEVINSQAPSLSRLSGRELAVARLVSKGLSSKEIANSMAIKLKTVEVHRYNILRKLKIKNTAAMVNLISLAGL